MSDSRSGIIIDVLNRRSFPGTVEWEAGRITRIVEEPTESSQLILPGLIDAHIHIESSMLPPAEFGRLALAHGTVATVSDPHEIANVLGMEGLRFMLDNAELTPLKICFGAPSCVPATHMETAGATISPDFVDQLLAHPRVGYLSEVMNFPGVLHGDPDMMQKIAVAKKHHKPIDGHAPGLRGDDARRYCEASISTDHECFTLDEALDKLQWGMKIIIREGSAARNFDALHSLIASHTNQVMLCSDDRHPDSLVQSHIDGIVRRALALGYDAMDVLQAACVNPVRHYALPVGLLQQGDAADFIVVQSWEDFRVLECVVNGRSVARNGRSTLDYHRSATPNAFHAQQIDSYSLRLTASHPHIRVIDVHDGQLVTTESIHQARIVDGFYEADTERDLLKIAVVNRYIDAAPAVAFIRNMGLKSGAMASSVAHDSHNVVAVGCSDEELARAINAVIEAKGGVCVVQGDSVDVLPLPIAGLMSDEPGVEVAQRYGALDAKARSLGSTLRSPFMSLSFMALLVIPELKLSDLGLFDGRRFQLTELGLRD